MLLFLCLEILGPEIVLTKRLSAKFPHTTFPSPVPPSKIYETCNHKPCQISEKSFRTQQCETYNQTPFRNKIYTWEEFDASELISTNLFSPCKLYCKAQGHEFFYALNDQVIDGTECRLESDHLLKKPTTPKSLLTYVENPTKTICVDGVCQKLGCDGNLNSTAKLDSCGICNGKNHLCRETAQDLMFTKFPIFGSNLIATLPENCRNINLTVDWRFTHEFDNFVLDFALGDDQSNQLLEVPPVKSTQKVKNYFIGGPINQSLKIIISITNLVGLSFNSIYGQKIGKISFVAPIGEGLKVNFDPFTPVGVNFYQSDRCSTTGKFLAF